MLAVTPSNRSLPSFGVVGNGRSACLVPKERGQESEKRRGNRQRCPYRSEHGSPVRLFDSGQQLHYNKRSRKDGGHLCIRTPARLVHESHSLRHEFPMKLTGLLDVVQVV